MRGTGARRVAECIPAREPHAGCADYGHGRRQNPGKAPAVTTGRQEGVRMENDPNTPHESDHPPDMPFRKGQVIVTTKSGSRYFIDLDLMLLQRIQANQETDRVGEAQSVALRRDGQRLKILRLYRLEVGSRAEFDLEPLGDPSFVAFTRRSTTEVISIEALPSPAAHGKTSTP